MRTDDYLFDMYVAVDWSARSTPSPDSPSKDALWVAEKSRVDNHVQVSYWRTRHDCAVYLLTVLRAGVVKGTRTLIGYDFNFGFPSGFVDALHLSGTEPRWRRVWNHLNSQIGDHEGNENNRFDVASSMNEVCGGSTAIGPFWGCPAGRSYRMLQPKSPPFPFVTQNAQSLRRLRHTETRQPGAQPVWKLLGRASVGGQTLVGIPAVSRLREDTALSGSSSIWPFETGFDPGKIRRPGPLVLHVEIWPGIISSRYDRTVSIKDEAQVRAVVDWMSDCDESGYLAHLFEAPKDLSADDRIQCVEEEGWILGSGCSEVV